MNNRRLENIRLEANLVKNNLITLMATIKKSVDRFYIDPQDLSEEENKNIKKYREVIENFNVYMDRIVEDEKLLAELSKLSKVRK